MTTPRVVALFGLSGVGKGWIAQHVCEQRPDVLHLEASALMKLSLQTSSEALRTAVPDKMADNQICLVSAFCAARAESPLRPVLFDGHSVIDNDRLMFEIPVAIIAGLSPDRIVFVSDEPSVIAERRRYDVRPRPVRSAAELSVHQNLARSVTAGYAEVLMLPFIEVSARDWETVARLFDRGARPGSAQGTVM